MNTKPTALATTTLLAAMLLPTHLRAIEAPEDNTPPPAEAAHPAVPAPAYLGIITSPVPQSLRDHLNLAENEGVVVTSVVPDGPAAKANLSANDIIVRIDDKKITSPQEISNLISGHKVGDEILVHTIHKGKATERKATLGKRPDHLPMAGPMDIQEIPALEGIPAELADRIRRMVEDQAGGLANPLADPENIPLPQEMPGLKEQMRKELKGMKKIEGKEFRFDLLGKGIQGERATTFRMMDNDGSIELKSNDDSKEVTVRDSENNVTWRGPWDTEQDKAAAPDDIRERIERLNIDGNEAGLNLELLRKR